MLVDSYHIKLNECDQKIAMLEADIEADRKKGVLLNAY